MDIKNDITAQDAIFFLDMIDSTKSPNFEAKMYRRKPYYDLIKNKDLNDYQRFKFVYQAMRYVLPEREQFVLDQIYGADKESSKLESIGKMLGVSGRRVGSIRSKGEWKIAKALLPIIKDNFI